VVSILNRLVDRKEVVGVWKDLLSIIAVIIGAVWALGSLYYQAREADRQESMHRTNVGKLQLKMKTEVLPYENGLKLIKVDVLTKNVGTCSLKLHKERGLRILVRKMEPIKDAGVMPSWPDSSMINKVEADDASDAQGGNMMPQLRNNGYHYSLEPGQEYHDVDVVSVKDTGYYLVRVAYYREPSGRVTDYNVVKVD
jgi:hypothetical protein